MAKTGLVLEGGGVRGIYTAGVLDAFMENRISFDGVIGVSAGAIHGCSFLSGQKGRSVRYYKRFSKDPRFMGMKSLLTTGDYVGAEFCYHTLPDKLDLYDHQAFDRNPAEFYVTCTNVETGEAEYHLITDMKTQIDYMRASASLPYFSKIVEINGKKYLDGGCTDCIPIDAFSKMGYEKNVVVLTRPSNYRRSKENLVLAKAFYNKYPNFIKAMSQRHERYNSTVEKILQLEDEGKIFVIRPESDLNIGRLEKDPVEIQRVYDIGYADGKRCVQKLKEWLSK